MTATATLGSASRAGHRCPTRRARPPDLSWGRRSSLFLASRDSCTFEDANVLTLFEDGLLVDTSSGSSINPGALLSRCPTPTYGDIGETERPAERAQVSQ